MGRRCWSLDQCFAAVLVGSSHCCPGCLFGHDPPANSLASSRASDSRVLPVVGLRCRHRGQSERLSTTGIPEFLFVERWGQIQTRFVCVSSVLDRTGVGSLPSVTSGIPQGATGYIVSCYVCCCHHRPCLYCVRFTARQQTPFPSLFSSFGFPYSHFFHGHNLPFVLPVVDSHARIPSHLPIGLVHSSCYLMTPARSTYPRMKGILAVGRSPFPHARFAWPPSPYGTVDEELPHALALLVRADAGSVWRLGKACLSRVLHAQG